MAPTIESPLPTMAPTATPKGMSSRLMTMKFMQRGEASAKSSPSSTPKTDNEGSAKRRKTAHKDTPEAQPLYDEKAVQAAIDEEESKRQAAIARRAKELGDEQWVLKGTAISAPDAKQRASLNFVRVGFAQIDSGLSDDSGDDTPTSRNVTGLAGRRQFNMKKGKKRAAQPKSESDDSGSSDSEDESASEGSSSDEEGSGDRGRQSQSEGTPSANRRRHSHSVSKRREAERIKAQELAEKRRKKEVKLNTLKSLSSGGAPASAFGKNSYTASMKCFGCGKTGHSKANCPSRRKSGA